MGGGSEDEATMKQLAQRAFREALAAVDIGAALEKNLARDGNLLHVSGLAIDLRDFDSVLAIAFGKAAFAMAEGFAKILGPEYHPEGIMVVPQAPVRELPGWKTFIGGHPVPNAASFEAGQTILERLCRCDERTLIFFLISGGGSSLVEWPLDPAMNLADFQALNAALVTGGASIEEINALRKHLSATKGGRSSCRGAAVDEDHVRDQRRSPRRGISSRLGTHAARSDDGSRRS